MQDGDGNRHRIAAALKKEYTSNSDARTWLPSCQNNLAKVLVRFTPHIAIPRRSEVISEMYTFMRPPENTILIVDDDPLHLTIYKWILQREGYQCRTALVGSTSVDLPLSERIDLVLLDYRLSSSLTAPEVAEQVKSAFPEAPIVVLSELPWMPDDIRAYAAAFVNKGEPKRLIETLAAVLRGKPSPA